MTQIAEYRDVEMARQVTLQTTEYQNSYGSVVKVELIHRPKGWQPAGSVARYCDHDVWAVGDYRTGAFCGRQFLTEAEARKYLLNVISQ